ncbi:gliding motility lipoprotein GldD [Bacteroidia bacterium]|nr:gliding motility lipoprotein GldD [Bacteroidia bacterium]
MVRKFANLNKIVIVCLLLAGGIACTPTVSVKPRGYYRIDLPAEKNYTPFAPQKYPYSFEIDAAAQIVPDSSPDAEPFWVDVVYPQYNAKIHISYKNLQHNSLARLVEDVHYMVYKHTVKADEITEQAFENEARSTLGFLYDIGGDAASNLQFYLTDERRHFLRGALYFDVHPNRDSLQPVILYITQDIQHLMETLQWQ